MAWLWKPHWDDGRMEKGQAHEHTCWKTMMQGAVLTLMEDTYYATV